MVNVNYEKWPNLAITSFRSPALRQKHNLNVCHTSHQNLTKFYFGSTQGSKEISTNCNFHYMTMPMMMSQILNSVDFTKTQKSGYLENETFFLQIKKLTNYTSRATLRQKNSSVVEVTSKQKTQHFLGPNLV